MLRSVRAFIFSSLLLLISTSAVASTQRCVILLHGLARSHYSMSTLATILQSHHYIVVNQDYPSTKESIPDLANDYIQPMINTCLLAQANEIDFVTHSLGGIVLQAYLQNHTESRIKNIIMLGPPNHGSPLADIFHNNIVFRFFTGEAGQELTTDQWSIPNTLHRTSRYQIGIIAGNYSLIPFSHFFFHEANDGKVTISSTKINTMKDFIVLPVSHTFMMNDASVDQQILYFFDHGKFLHI